MSKNSKARIAGHVPAETFEPESEERTKQKRIAQIQTKREKFTKTVDIVADSELHYRNHKIPKSSENFPIDYRMQFADLYYPYAKGGPLYIDQPSNPHDVALCERKFKRLEKHEGFREYGLTKDQIEQGLRNRYAYMRPGDNATAIICLLETGKFPDTTTVEKEAEQ